MLAYVFGGLAIGAYFTYDGLKKYLLRQKINNTPTSKVQSAAVGLVEILGRAKSNGNVISPITKTKCAFWKITALRHVSGKGGGHWQEFWNKNSTDFYIADETGEMLIDPTGGDITFSESKSYSGYLYDKGPLGISQKKLDKLALDFIETLDNNDRSEFRKNENRNILLDEEHIKEGDTLYVLGTAEPKANAIASEKGYENLSIVKGKFDKILYIRNDGEKKIVDELGKWMIPEIIVGLILMAVGLLLFFIWSGVKIR